MASKRQTSDPDNPIWTEEDFARAKLGREVLPKALLDQFGKRRGRPVLENPKRLTSLRLDPEVVEAYRATGKGWQSRINQDLRKAVGL